MADERKGKRILFYFMTAVVLVVATAKNDHFHEELLLKPMNSGHVYAHFHFTTTWEVDVTDEDALFHFNLFPKSFGQIIKKYSVEEFHLSLTQGLWQYSQWGYPVTSAPPGAELWVWFQQSVKDRVNENWFGLTQAISGQFCASLNFIDNKTTESPQFSFRREGISISQAQNSSFLRYAALPREVVCTENLTPWKKLLPCDSKAGLSTLFNALFLYSVSYHSLGVHLRPVCKDKDCRSPSVELTQTVSIMFDPVLRDGRKDWSFKKLFGHILYNACPLASSSKVYVDVILNKTGSKFTLTPKPTSMIRKLFPDGNSQEFGVYDVQEMVQRRKARFSIIFKWHDKPQKAHPPQLHAHRFVTGFGEQKGGIKTLIYNHHPIHPLPVVYFAMYPWFLKMYLHTLKINSKGRIIKPDILKFTPGKDRHRPYTLEMMFTLPPDSVTELSIEFDRGFLKWTEHPPDAHHGFYVNSEVISAKVENSLNYTGRPLHSSLLFERTAKSEDIEEEIFIRLHTETLLISIATPDFSMPYNVICLACTVVAIAFGSFHNLATRGFEACDPRKEVGLVGKVLAKLKSKFVRSKNDTTTGDKIAQDKPAQEKKDE